MTQQDIFNEQARTRPPIKTEDCTPIQTNRRSHQKRDIAIGSSLSRAVFWLLFLISTECLRARVGREFRRSLSCTVGVW
jgi:hypothetical protein